MERLETHGEPFLCQETSPGLTTFGRFSWLATVRTINQSWRRLAEGAARAEHLESELREQWADRVREARERADAEADAAWRADEDARLRRHRTALAEWEQRERKRMEQVERDRTLWADELAQARQRAGALAQSAGMPVFAVSASLAASARRLMPRWAAPLAVAVATAAPAMPSTIRWALLSRKDPARRTKPESEPVDPGAAPRPVRQPDDPVGLDVKKPWLHQLGRGHVPYRAREEGDDGVDNFLWALEQLPDSYFVVRELLVAKSLDVDVLAVGPTGIWVFEVKHWSGHIACTRGAWTRRQEYFAKGGRHVVKEQTINPFDGQWVREAEAVKKGLGRHLAQNARSWKLAGGLAFTHPEASFDIDDSCRCAFETPHRWVDDIRRAAAVDDFAPADQLAVLDALFAWAHEFEDRTNDKPADAVELAEQIHASVAARAAAYCDR